MSEEGTDNQVTDGDLLPGLNLKSAAKSIAEARARLTLRQTVGRELRGAIKYILEAQEKVEGRGTIPELRLDLLEAIRHIGAVEAALKGSEPDSTPEEPPEKLSPRESSPEAQSRTASSPADKRTAAAPAPLRDATTIPEPGSPQAPPPRRPSLSALASSDDEVAPDTPAQRGVTQPQEPAPPPVAMPATDAPAPERASLEPVDSSNRRGFVRLSATYTIQMQAPYNGFSDSDLTQLPISGVTLNVSRGGMLAEIDQGILRHGRYLIRFLGAGPNLRPEIMWGRVRRSRAADSGWEVGIEFDSPLEILRP